MITHFTKEIWTRKILLQWHQRRPITMILLAERLQTWEWCCSLQSTVLQWSQQYNQCFTSTHITDFHSPMIMTLWQWRHSSVARSVVWTLSHVTEPITGISHSPRYGPVASPVRPGLTGVKLLQQLYQLSLHCSSSAPVGPASLWTRSNISTIGSPSHIHPLQSPTLLLLSGLSVLVAG